MSDREGGATTPETAYCPVCWGTGCLYEPALAASGSSCGCCAPDLDGMEPRECVRCAGTGRVTAAAGRL